ncbi:MAG TPA: hypothetical protein VNH11_09050 [Pirellulales bacterium]|nr:hypothetical protein [Pirellulales bacterium]
MASIEDGPHYEIHSMELAKWLDEKAAETWWNVDGDPLLTGRMPFPAPADELAAELRKIDRFLIAEASPADSEARGQLIRADEVEPRLIRSVGDLYRSKLPPDLSNDKYLSLRWKGANHEWLLVEDSLTAEQFREETVPKAN